MDAARPLVTPKVGGLAGDDVGYDSEEWAAVHPRRIDEEQWQRYEGYLREIFTALGLPTGTLATDETPHRFLRALFDATSGYEGDAKLVTAFPTECHGGPDCRISQVVEGPIPFFSLCEHHSLPFFGTAYVGYIAHEHILGLSKLTRLVRLFARRFSVQERIGQQLADALERILQPHGVAVHIEAVHLCTQMRGGTRVAVEHPHHLLARQLRHHRPAAHRVLRTVRARSRRQWPPLRAPVRRTAPKPDR